jgi:hypothetical protein
MAYGFSVTNSSDFIQVGEDYSNYVVVASGTALGNRAAISIQDYGVLPLIMVKPDIDVIIACYYVKNNEFSFTAVGPGGGSDVRSVSYKLLVPANVVTPSTESFGLRVYNGSGGLTFDSGREYLKINQVLKITATSGGVTAAVLNADSWYSLNTLGLFGTALVNASQGPWIYKTLKRNADASIVIMGRTLFQGPYFVFELYDTQVTIFAGVFP